MQARKTHVYHSEALAHRAKHLVMLFDKFACPLHTEHAHFPATGPRPALNNVLHMHMYRHVSHIRTTPPARLLSYANHDG